MTKFYDYNQIKKFENELVIFSKKDDFDIRINPFVKIGNNIINVQHIVAIIKESEFKENNFNYFYELCLTDITRIRISQSELDELNKRIKNYYV